MNSFQPRLDILPETQKRLWSSLAPAKKLGFVLYGGTAIALRLGHRESVDFDFFSSRPLDKDALLRELPAVAEQPPLQAENDTYTVLVQGVKLSFFGNLPFGCYSLPELTSDRVLQVAALEDLMALKLKVILQRSEAKDYQDIAAMVRHGISVEKGLAIAEQMFHPQFSPMVATRALTYFGDGNLSTLPTADKDTVVKTVRHLQLLPAVSQVQPHLSSWSPPDSDG
jgi:hypothetical protein